MSSEGLYNRDLSLETSLERKLHCQDPNEAVSNFDRYFWLVIFG